ncbi:MAG: hypothetical protein HYV42_02800 [Candidatus Magasanikbacteria bacterium]|nr:hypothetical protein [Candidatus Magasanikbacteria bacterium]
MTFRLRLKYQRRALQTAWHSLGIFRLLGGANGRAGLLLAIIMLTAGYVWKTSQLSTGGFIAQKLEREIKEAGRAVQAMESEAAQLQSLTSIEERLQGTNLVAVTNIRYLKAAPLTALAGR